MESEERKSETLTVGIVGAGSGAVVVDLRAFGVEGRSTAEEASGDFLGFLFGEFEVGDGGGRDVVVGGRRVGSVGEAGGTGLVVVLALQGGWGGVAGDGVLRLVGHGGEIGSERKRRRRKKP